MENTEYGAGKENRTLMRVISGVTQIKYSYRDCLSAWIG